MPDRSAKFPYGLDKVPIPTVDLQTLFARDLVVLLGSDDIETENLRQDKGAKAQGGEEMTAVHAVVLLRLCSLYVQTPFRVTG